MNCKRRLNFIFPTILVLGFDHMSQATPTMIKVSQGQMLSPSRHCDVMISGMQMNGVHVEYPPVSIVGNNIQSQVNIKRNVCSTNELN